MVKKRGTFRIVLVVLNAILAGWATFVFLVFLKFSLLAWLMMNICSPTQFLVIIGLLSKRKILMNVSVPLLLFFGFGGLFMFSWSGHMVVAQISHLVMSVTAIYILTVSIRDKEIKKMLIGLGIGILVLVLLQFVVFPWYYAHPDPEVLEMMKEMGFKGKMNK